MEEIENLAEIVAKEVGYKVLDAEDNEVPIVVAITKILLIATIKGHEESEKKRKAEEVLEMDGIEVI